MNLLCWNYRRLGNPQTEQELGDLIRAHSPLVMFLVETWLKKAMLIYLRDKLKFDGMIEFSREGRGGRVAVFWKKDVEFLVDTYSSNHIDVVINKGKEEEWRFTDFYGESDTNNHHISWATLRRLNSKFSLPWLCAGDFNEINRAHEKLGGGIDQAGKWRSLGMCWMSVGFKIWDLVATSSLGTMGMERGIQWERLDRVVSTVDWLSMFSDSKVVHMESGTSDHKLIMIYLAGIPKRVNKRWRFEQMWMRDEGCREVIEDAWSFEYQGSPMRRVENKMDRCRGNLKWWRKVAFDNVTRGLREKKEQLRVVEEAAIRGGSISRVQRLKKEISKLLVSEEQMWKQ